MSRSRSTGAAGGRRSRCADLTRSPDDLAGIHAAGAAFWPLAMARELDDALLHLRLNEPDLGLLVFRSRRRSATVCWPPTRC